MNHDNERKTCPVSMLIRPSVRRKWEAMAAAEGRSLTQMFERLVERRHARTVGRTGNQE